MKSVAEISANIDAALTPNYENGSITIEDINVVVKHIGKLNFHIQIKTGRCVHLRNKLGNNLFQFQKTVQKTVFQQSLDHIFGLKQFQR